MKTTLIELRNNLFDVHAKQKVFIPAAARSVIDNMVQEDEGGWRYTDHPADPDKGTFGGVRYITFANTYKTHMGRTISVEEFKTAAEKFPNELRECCILIYYTEYMRKVGGVFWADAGLSGIMAVVYSAGVNCGPERAVRWMQSTINKMQRENSVVVDGIWGAKTQTALADLIRDKTKEYFAVDFLAHVLTAWEDYYTEITLKNFEAWVNAAKYPSAEMPDRDYSKFYRGWFNRVKKYRKMFSIWERP